MLFRSDHPNVATSLNNLALLYKSQGRYDQAEPLLLQALNICERRLRVDHPDTVTVRKNLEALRAAIYSKRQHFDTLSDRAEGSTSTRSVTGQKGKD